MALCLALVQPLLAGGWLPGLYLLRGRRVHRAVGVVLVAAVVVHVAGLWMTSPPDIIDALLLRSPTPFSVWGVGAMWALFAAALLAALRRRLSPRAWRVGHTSLVSIVVLGGAIHAMLIEGTMETTSKAVLCGLTIAATVAAVTTPWLRARRRALGKE
ncbi:Ferric reductase like transmembrane component [compost metagenome]